MSLRSIKAKSLGRLELLEWINSLLEADYSKVEHLGDGVAYMQILDAVHPTLRSTHLYKINFNARTENQRISNLRVVQEALVVSGVAKDLPVKQLARCKFADNISMLQWCYAFVHKKYSDANTNYRARQAREESMRHQEDRRRRRRTGSGKQQQRGGRSGGRSGGVHSSSMNQFELKGIMDFPSIICEVQTETNVSK